MQDDKAPTAAEGAWSLLHGNVAALGDSADRRLCMGLVGVTAHQRADRSRRHAVMYGKHRGAPGQRHCTPLSGWSGAGCMLEVRRAQTKVTTPRAAQLGRLRWNRTATCHMACMHGDKAGRQRERERECGCTVVSRAGLAECWRFVCDDRAKTLGWQCMSELPTEVVDTRRSGKAQPVAAPATVAVNTEHFHPRTLHTSTVPRLSVWPIGQSARPCRRSRVATC